MHCSRWILSALVALVAAASEARAADFNGVPGADVAVGVVSPAVVQALGIESPDGDDGAAKSAPVTSSEGSGASEDMIALGTSGVPNLMDVRAPFSAAVAAVTDKTGVVLLGDWDGREDLTADIQGYVDELSGRIPEPGTPFALTRTAVSAHSRANGFNENVFYYGDAHGNVYVSWLNAFAGELPAAQVFVVNLPTVLNAFGTINSSSRIVVTGLAVNPVADLSSYANVNANYTASFGGRIGEVLFVSYWDTGGGLRLAADSRPVHSGLLAFPIADVVSPAPDAAVLSPAGFPVTVGKAFGVAFSAFANLAGVAVDDDGSAYFHQVDLVGFTGANIVKIADEGTNRDRSPATNGYLTINSLTPANGDYGTASGPAAQVNRFTNYSGTSKTFGNVVALAAGPGNVLYAAVADSSKGLFRNPAAIGPTPSMIITFADASGAFDACSSPNGVDPGIVRLGDGIADPQVGTTVTPGVNNFRAFALGTGPEKRLSSSLFKGVFGTKGNTLKLDFVVDYSIYSGLTVDEQGAVYLVSGGTPAAVGLNPSPTRGEILLFPDQEPFDRRADKVDLRRNTLPNPPDAGTNAGDGDSDRYDHLFLVAPIDPLTMAPGALSGLSRGFLRYLNRTAPSAVPNLPNGSPQGDDIFSGPMTFAAFDPSEQVAGGNDADYPNLGDDAGGGFEFNFGNLCTAGLTAFYLNSNGSVTFSAGSTDASSTPDDLWAGPSRIAAAWTDLNPNARGTNTINFPVQALGFAGPNAFKVRWIDIPRYAFPSCGSRNTFSITLFDDGTGADETGLGQEGATDLRFARRGRVLVGAPPRPDKSGRFSLQYGAMDLPGQSSDGGFTLRPVLAGYSVGGQAPPAPAETNLSRIAPAQFVGAGTQSAIYEFFNSGAVPPTPRSDFDLRFEGNSGAVTKPVGQVDADRDFLRFFGVGCQ